MRLQTEPFERIKSGIKTLELRINDPKRRHLRMGDTITFHKLPEENETITVTVTGLFPFPSFAALFDALPPQWLGYTDADRDWLETSVRDIYPAEEEAEYGVLGIRIKLALFS